MQCVFYKELNTNHYQPELAPLWNSTSDKPCDSLLPEGNSPSFFI